MRKFLVLKIKIKRKDTFSPAAKQRVIALFLVVIFAVSIITPVSAVAMPPKESNIKAADYAAGMRPIESKTTAAADAAPALQGSPLANTSKTRLPMGEALQAVIDQPKITPHELTDKRTATSSVSVNADGTLTEKHFMTPKHFQKEGKWEIIDTTLVEDKNAGDSGNVFGRAVGQVQSWFSSTTNFMVKENDWSARFSPSDFDKGMVRIQKGGDQIGFVPVNAKKVAPVVTTGEDGKQTVHYYDLWPGINVEYTVESAALKENIVIKDKNAVHQVSFRLLGAGLEKRVEKHKVGNEELNIESNVLKGVFNDEFAIAPPNLILNNFGLVTENGVFGQTYKDGVITVSIDKTYLQNLPDNAFPAVIDPTTFNNNFGTRAGGNYVSFKSDGYICYSNVCNLYAGSLYDAGGWLRWWRGAFFAPYDQFRNSNNNLINATLHLQQRSNESFWTGGWDTHNYQVGHATCLNNFHCVDGIWHSGNVAGSGDINVTNLYQSRIAAGDFGAWMMVMGEDGTDHSFKNFDPGVNGNGTDGSYVAFTYGGPPPAPSMGSPVADQVYADPQPSFKVSAIGNPNGSTPLKYQILVSTAPAATGGLVASNVLDTTQWTIPDGILQDGSTYYAQARSFDPITNVYSGWGTSVPFRIDMRTGKDKTQTYDSLGAVDVDLATGNVTTSASSHTSAALGGSLGVGLDYNSSLRSRNGLVGEYWNNQNWNGAPVVTRVDQNLDFNWETGSPSSGAINNDSTSARWTGYFVAPKTGSYQFGGSNDDLLKITINNQVIYDNWGCYSGQCYGASISLTEGQVLPIKVEHVEVGGPAYARMFVKGAVDEQVVPSDWLQTGVRPITNQKGLTGRYYFDDGSHNFVANRMFMQRDDPLVSLHWGGGSPVAGGPEDNFLARWTGYFTPPVSGNYEFGTVSDDGSRIYIGTNNTLVMNKWQDGTATEQYGSGVTLTAGQPVPITVEYYEHTGAAAMHLLVRGAVPTQIVPSNWLSPKAQVLPEGWNLGLDPDGSINYDRVKINQNSVVLTDSTGSTHEYIFKDGGYKPPVNEGGQLVRNEDGTFTLQDADGRTYVFSTDGTLASVTTPADDRKPAALQYAYASVNGGPATLTQITDAVDNTRWAKVYYSGDNECGSAPGGFDANAPTGMLCAVKTNDGRATYFYYIDGQLARIAKPGNELTDYQYEEISNSGGATIGYRLVSVRDVTANDAVAAGVRSNDNTVKTQLSYDVLGRATNIKQPAATSGADRIEHAIEYLSGAIDKSYWGKTRQHVVGATEPHGFSRQVIYDNLFRTMEETDIANLTAKNEWDPLKDLLLSTTDAAGLKSTTIYDDEDRPVENYGAAPQAWYGSDRKPLAAYANQVPRTDAAYDEGINGASVAWFNVKGNSLFGAPKLHTTGINTNDPTWMFDDGTPPITPDAGMDGYGLSATGKVRFPGSGTYTIKLWHDDGARLWINDQLVIDDWAHRSEGTATSHKSATFVAEAGKPYRFRYDYLHVGTPGFFELWVNGPGITSVNADLGVSRWSFLKPGYSLATSSKAYDSTIGDTTAVTDYGVNPELGLPQSTTLDSTGLNLTSSMTYEQQGTTGSFLRPTSKTLPGGNTTNYSYYTAGELRDNPCTQEVEAFKQAGFMKFKTEPSPDGSTSGGGGGAAPVIQSSTSGTTGSGVLTLNKPSGTVDGDLLVMTASADLSENENVTYTVPSGWTELLPLTRSHATNAGNNLQVWYKIASSEPANYAITPDHNNLIGGSIMRIDGQAASSFIHQQAVTASDTGEASAPSVTTTVDNALVLRLATWDQSKTLLTAPSGHTQSYHVDVSGHDNWGGYKTQTTSGSTGAGQFDLSSGSPYVGFTVAIVPQNAGATGGSSNGRVSEAIYDDAGRVVASRYNNDGWTCVTYDSRGRISQTIVPTINGRPGRTVTTNYNYQGNPLKVQLVDSVAGTAVAEVDLLGRSVSSADTFGNTSTVTYDSLGRTTSKTSPLGTETYTYDQYNRVTEYFLDSTKYATVTYDAFSRIQDVIYNQAEGEPTQQPGPTPTVQSSTSGSTSSGALTLNKPSGTANGDLLVMTASADLSASEDVTYSVPSGWTQLLANTRSDTSGAGNNLQVWYKIANNEPASYAITPDHDNLIGGSIMRITGHDASSPIDVSNAAASVTGEASAPSVTTTVNNTLALRFATWDQSKTVNAIPSGHTQTYHVDVSGHDNWGGYKEQATPGATGAAQFDLSGGAPYVGFTVAVKPAGGGTASNTLKLEQVKRDSMQRVNGSVFRFSNGQTFDETVNLSQSGLVTGYTDAFNGQSVANTYAYDKAGRLTGANVDTNTYTYGYGAPSSGTCNQNSANLNAHKNSNRTSFTVNGATTTYCYDKADRLLSSSDAQLGTPTYDDHGNTVTLAGNGAPITFGYNALDQNTSIEQGSYKVEYVKAGSGAVLRKKEYQNNQLTASYRYLGGGVVLQTCSLTNDNDCVTADKYLGLPGGVSLTLSPDNPDPAKRTVYSIQNFHGDTAMTVDENGAPTSSVYLYEPFGQPSSSATFGTNSNPANATDQSMGWAASPTRKVAGAFTLPIIQMGARVYLPTAARFLQTDPVEGGTPNPYVYPADPINANDYSGLLSVRNSSSGNIRLTVTYNYGMQYGWGGNNLQSSNTVAKHIQPTASAARTQGPGSITRTSATTAKPSLTLKKLPAPTLRTIDLSAIPNTTSVRGIGTKGLAMPEPSLWERIYPRVSHALNTGDQYSQKGEIVGYLGGCVGGALMASPTIIGTAAGCAGGVPVGGEIGKVAGGLLGIAVGLFTY